MLMWDMDAKKVILIIHLKYESGKKSCVLNFSIMLCFFFDVAFFFFLGRAVKYCSESYKYYTR